MGPQTKSSKIPVLGCWKSELRFPHLKAAARELLGMTTTSAPSERVFSHAGELYSKKRATRQSWHTNLCYSHAYEDESTFGHEF